MGFERAYDRHFGLQRGDDDVEGYDVAQVCLNGHITNSSFNTLPQHNQRFCDKCGQPTVTECPSCNKHIRGRYHNPRVVGTGPTRPPMFCRECGKPYPWTETSLNAARELADDIDSLSEEEKEVLKCSFDDLVTDTARTALAATRFKRLATKAGSGAATALKDILIHVLSETAKKLLWPAA